LFDARAHRIGDRIENLSFTAIDGTPGTTHSMLDGHAALVIVMRDAECPLCRRYGPTLARLAADTAPDVAFLFVNVSEIDDTAAIQADAKRFGLAGTHASDHEGAIASALRATSTTDVFVLDGGATLVYRGAVDDQYGIGYQRASARHTYLRDALAAVIDSVPPPVSATRAPGCVIAPKATRRGDRAVTYHDQVARIMQSSCVSCHRPGQVGPFRLDGYAAVKGRRGMIRSVVEQGLMPPWGAAGAAGHWRNDRRLSAEDRTALRGWIDAGCPEGDPAHAPAPRAWPESWSIGMPDAIVEVPVAHRVPAEGALDYRYEYVQTDFGRDVWIEAMEFELSAPQVVHHVLTFIEAPKRAGESRRERRRRWQGGLHGYFGAMVPGQGPTDFGKGRAKLLPAGSWLKFQVHYTPNGEEAFNLTRLGLRFAAAPPTQIVHTNSVTTEDFRIPAGAPRHEVTATARIPKNIVVDGFSPHMHLRGTAFRYSLRLPDGTEETLLDVPRYDFNWQTMYRLAAPRMVPAGSVLTCRAWFDNSADNPANPDPGKAVGFGEQTWDEMMIGYFEWHEAR
jgi:mono/diheme cytochrome c family protein